MSTEPIPVDLSFPQLKVAGDPKLMREIFQRHLRPLGGKSYRVRECRIFRIRHRQAISCILQYALLLEEPETGHERSHWVTGLMYTGGQSRKVWKKLRPYDPGRESSEDSLLLAPFRWIREGLRRSDPRRNPPDASSLPFAPFSYVPELDMLLQVFPYDFRLPALPLLIAGSPPELEPLLLARFGPGDWRFEAWDVEPVRYLAGARATLRLTARARDVSSTRVEEKRFYAKVYHKEEQGEQTYQVLRVLWEKSTAGGAGFTVGRPVAYLSSLKTLIQEETTGTSLAEVLSKEDDHTLVMRKVARALVTLHLDHTVAPRLHPPWKEKEVATLRRVGNLLRVGCPRLGPEIEETVSAVIAGLKEVPPTPIHGDFKLDHIMLDGDRLALVDLDDFAEADPILDVARVLASLANAATLLSHDRAWTAARAFAEEYFAHVPGAWRARLPLHYAGAVLKTAGATYRRQTPGWSDKIEALLEEAKDSLAGRVW